MAGQVVVRRCQAQHHPGRMGWHPKHSLGAPPQLRCCQSPRGSPVPPPWPAPGSKMDLPWPLSAAAPQRWEDESVVGSQKAFPLTSWTGMCPPAAHRVAPVPQQGMTAVEPLPYSPPDLAWTHGALRCVHRLVPKAEGQGYVAKPCHHQPQAISSCTRAVPDPRSL